ncbi:MAG: type I-E CRISPR-associated protein Cse1/CasA [Thiobacillus sp.]|nr:type I-E CRISPR-associated protein Cse1/CasA [Thiobacillus sp.]
MNLLTDPLFRVRLSEGATRASLPELLALLGEDRVESLPGLQRHQEDALHIFLCYLAGAVLDRQGVADPRQTADFWLQSIRTLTTSEGCDNDDAWILAVADPTRPAFLQPPAPSKVVFDKDYKPKAASPDALDVLQTAKNHDIKASRGDVMDLEGWAYALLSAQTMTGLLGRGSGGGMNRGISRMNSGYGSRPRVDWLPSFRLGKQFTWNIENLLRHRPVQLSLPFGYQPDGKVLLWIPLWDGNTSHSLSSLDPFFIEIARRYRLVFVGANIQLWAAGSAQTFIGGADLLKGNVGDPWIPISSKTNGALTVPASGLTPELLRNLMFADAGFQPAVMQQIPTGQGAGWFAASVLVRGQGTTDGFHEAAIRIPEKARPVLFGKSPVRDRLAVLSKLGLDMASAIQYRVLQPALYALMEGGPVSINLDKREISQWVGSTASSFTRDWHPRYFDWLWTTLDQPNDSGAMKPWFEQLHRLAETVLEQSIRRVPMRHGRDYRAKVRARGMFYGSLKKHFETYLETPHEHP